MLNRKETHLQLTPKTTDILGLKKKLELARGLIERGGRTSIVRAVCQISKASVLQLHKEIFGRGPSAGLLPYDPDWITKSPDNCLHASIYSKIYQVLSTKTTACKGEIFLAAYILYEQTLMGKTPVLNINRAWYIGQQINIGYLSEAVCSRCDSVYVAIKEFPVPYKLCPLCDSTTDGAGRLRWRQIRIHKRIYRPKKAQKCTEDIV